MTVFQFETSADTDPNIGLIVLQADQRIEQDFRRLFHDDIRLLVTRVPSGLAVTPDTLQEMQDHIPRAAALLPQDQDFDAVGYGCTSGAAQIGQQKVADLVRQGIATAAVSDPLSALVMACGELGIHRLAVLSPYIEDVSAKLRDALAGNGIETPVFGTFCESQEAKVARISADSIKRGAIQLAYQGDVQAIFLSCTNLNTLDVIPEIEAETGVPVLSSNLVLAWHLLRLSGVHKTLRGDNRLLTKSV